MCPLRLILVFLSATVAGYFAWKSLRSSFTKSDDEIAADRDRESGFGKVIGRGFWVFVDMASGRYLWRNLRKEGEKAKGC